MITEYVIYGERCSGTNYLRDLMETNFDVKFTRRGHKHFFGFSDLSNTDHVLFLCIVRDPVKCFNSLFRDRHNIASHLYTLENLFDKEFWSLDPHNHEKELMTDRNIYTGERYRNIFEMRHTKIKYLLEDLPNFVKHHLFIRYEDLIDNFDETMNRIKNMGIPIKESVADSFPVNSTRYKGLAGTVWNPKSKKDAISRKFILNHPNFLPYYEEKLGYI